MTREQNPYEPSQHPANARSEAKSRSAEDLPRDEAIKGLVVTTLGAAIFVATEAAQASSELAERLGIDPQQLDDILFKAKIAGFMSVAGGIIILFVAGLGYYFIQKHE